MNLSRRPNRRVTTAQRQQIIKLYEAGAKRFEIGAQMDLSDPTVRKVLKEEGYPPRKMTQNEVTQETIERIIKLRSFGIPYGKIAEMTGVGKRYVMTLIADHSTEIDSRSQSSVSPETFIKAWMESERVADVATRTGLSVNATLSRAYSYRQKGVPLKRLVSPRPFDWTELAEFADLFADE